LVACVELWHGLAIVAEPSRRESDAMITSENDRS
jgi:hypothetical protein